MGAVGFRVGEQNFFWVNGYILMITIHFSCSFCSSIKTVVPSMKIVGATVLGGLIGLASYIVIYTLYGVNTFIGSEVLHRVGTL